MKKEKKITSKSEWKTAEGVFLKATTERFEIAEREKADQFAKLKRSYVGHAIDKENKFCGFYVPA